MNTSPARSHPFVWVAAALCLLLMLTAFNLFVSPGRWHYFSEGYRRLRTDRLTDKTQVYKLGQGWQEDNKPPY